MKLRLICQLLIAAAITKPASADLNVVTPYGGNYSSSNPGDVVTVKDDGQITGGYQELTGSNGVFSLEKVASIVSGTQRLAGPGGRFEILTSSAILGGTQVIENGGTFNVNQSHGVSGSTLNIGSASTVQISADFALDFVDVNFNAPDATLQFTGGYYVDLGAISSGVAGGGHIAGSAGAAMRTFSMSGTTTYSGVISGPLNFSKDGSSTLVLTNTNNSFVGEVRANGGVLEFSDVKALGDASNVISVNRGTLRYGAGNTADISSRLKIDDWGTIDTNGNNITFASQIAGEGELTKTGGGTLRITSQDAFAGGTILNGGEIVLAGPTSEHGQLGGSPNSFIAIQSGTMTLESDNALVGTNPYSDTSLSIEPSGLLTTVNNTTILPEVFLSGTIQTTGAGNFTVGNYIFSSSIRAGNDDAPARITGGAVQFKGAISTSSRLEVDSRIIGNNDLVKTGRGTLALSGSNSFTGNIIATRGLIEFATVHSLGNTANQITLDGGGLRWGAGNTADLSSRITIGENGAFFDTGGNSVTFASSLSGTAVITKQGAGTLTLAAANPDLVYAIVESGTLIAAHDNAMGQASVSIKAGGVFKVEDNIAFSQYVGLSGGSYIRTVSGTLGGKMTAYDELDAGTGFSILAGSVSTTSTLILTASRSSSATNDGMRRGESFDFQGTGTNTFVLNLSNGYVSENSEIGWLDGNEWVSAIDGNIGNTATLAMQDYYGSYDQFIVEFSGYTLSQTIGAYGWDPFTQSVWAVLNHNSEFAVIPEPSSAILLAGGIALLAARRRREKQPSRS